MPQLRVWNILHIYPLNIKFSCNTQPYSLYILWYYDIMIDIIYYEIFELFTFPLVLGPHSSRWTIVKTTQHLSHPTEVSTACNNQSEISIISCQPIRSEYLPLTLKKRKTGPRPSLSLNALSSLLFPCSVLHQISYFILLSTSTNQKWVLSHHVVYQPIRDKYYLWMSSSL